MINFNRKILTVLFSLVFVPFLFGQTTPSGEIVMPGDAIRVKVWQLFKPTTGENPATDLNGDYIIDADGNVFMPYVGFINVAAKTPRQIEETIKNKYSTLLKESYIYVRPLIRLIFSGSIAKPGAYRIDPSSSLWELFEVAGGPASNADLKKIYVYRNGEKVIENLLTAFERAYSLQDVGIRSGDQIVVLPEKKFMSLQTLLNIINFGSTVVWIYLRINER